MTGPTAPGAPAPTRLRVRFTKTGKIRWTSHRDVARMWERALRRVGLPLAYSAGFSPRPKVSFGLALPTGHESMAEYLDLEVLAGPADLGAPDHSATIRDLSEALPDGLAVTAAAVIDRSEPSLQESVSFCTWRWAAVPLDAPGADGAATLTAAAVLADPTTAIASLMARPELVVTRTRKGKEHTEDIRPAILDVRTLAGPPPGAEPLLVDAGLGGPVWLEADLATQPRSIRPLEVLQALDPALDERQVRRLHQWILRDGARHEPLTAHAAARLDPGPGLSAATDAPHALGRVS